MHSVLARKCATPGAMYAWVGGMSFILFFALKMSGLLRVSQDIEEMGMDVSKHGGTAYEKQVVS